MQKITSISTIILIVGLEYFTKKEDLEHIKAGNQNRGEEVANRK